MKKIALALFLFLTPSVFAQEIHHEFVPEVVMDNADAMRGLSLAGFQYAYHINETFWVGVEGLVGKTVVDSGSGLDVVNNEWMWGGAPVFYWNIPALLGATKEKPEGSQAQVYTSFGVGYLRIGSEETPYGIFGGGLLWQSGLPWLGVRFDLKGMFYMLDNAGGSAFNSDLALSIGPSFYF